MAADDWYVLKGSRVVGPFSEEELRQWASVGRIRSLDRVSQTGELWEPWHQVPQLIPDSLLDLKEPEERDFHATR